MTPEVKILRTEIDMISRASTGNENEPGNTATDILSRIIESATDALKAADKIKDGLILKNKPTIAELEAMMDEPEKIEILPNGNVRTDVNGGSSEKEKMEAIHNIRIAEYFIEKHVDKFEDKMGRQAIAICRKLSNALLICKRDWGME